MMSPKLKPIVLFLHHYGGSSRSWDDVIARLPNVHCIAPDLRGFGEFEDGSAACRLSDYVSDLRDFVAASGIEQFVLVGHSMGGKIAMAAVAGGLVGAEALVLLAPSPPTPEPISDQARARLASTLQRAAGAEVVAAATAHALSPAVLERTIADVNRSSPAAWQAWLDSGSREDISNIIASIKLPTTVLSGENDQNIPTALIQHEVVARIRGASLAIIPGAGHLLPLEAPAAVAAAVQKVIDTLAARRAARSQHTVHPVVQPTSLPAHTAYPRALVLDLLNSNEVTDATRRAILPRAKAYSKKQPEFFSISELKTLQAVCNRLILQPTDRAPVEIAAGVDERLARGMGNGWRYAAMPPDGDFYRRAIHALDESANTEFGRTFDALDGPQQDRVLLAVQFDEVGGQLWLGLSPCRFFEELLAELAEIYYSHPVVQSEIGYAGMADANGWTQIGLNQLEAIEPRRAEAARA